MPVSPANGSHALAALALHEQPFGFGWPDHDMLVDLAREADQDAEDAAIGVGYGTGDVGDAMSSQAAATYRGRALHLRDLAARIAALLAPR